jgi:hypothetical protein
LGNEEAAGYRIQCVVWGKQAASNEERPFGIADEVALFEVARKDLADVGGNDQHLFAVGGVRKWKPCKVARDSDARADDDVALGGVSAEPGREFVVSQEGIEPQVDLCVVGHRNRDVEAGYLGAQSAPTVE